MNRPHSGPHSGPQSGPHSGSINISIGGSIQADQLALGQSIQQVKLDNPTQGRLSDAEWMQLQQAFEVLKLQIEQQVMASQQPIAKKRVEELKAAIAQSEPDLDRIAALRHWFAKHLPTLTGAVTSVIVNPIVGKLVEAAGDLLANDFRDRFGS